MAVYQEYLRSLTTWTPAYLSDMVPWAMLAAPGVMLHKQTKALQRTYLVRGQDLTGRPPEEQGAVMLRANRVLKRLGGQWMLQSEAQRVPLTYYPESGSQYPVAAVIDADRKQTVLVQPGARETRYYLTLTWQPPSPMTRAMSRVIVTGLPAATMGEGEAQQEVTVETFVRQADYLMELLHGVLATCRPLTSAEMLTYLHTTVSDRWHAVKRPACVLDLDSKLCTSNYVGGWYPRLGQWHLRTCSVVTFPEESTVGIMQALEAKDLDFRWCVRWLGMERETQKGILRRAQGAWVHHERGLLARMAESWSQKPTRIVDSDATNKAAETDAARQELGADIVAYGQFTSTVTVWDTDPEVADEKLLEVMQAFEGQGFLARHETQHATAAWLSSVPGDRFNSVRKTPQHTLTLAHMLPGFQAAYSGPEADSHFQAGPWFLAHTDTSSAFRVVNHVGDVGHFLMLGPTGAGKSTLMGFLVTQWLARYTPVFPDTQVFWFDLNRTARLLTLLLGGHWYDLGGGDIAFQPLRDIDQATERAWALGWLLDLCETGKVPVTSEVQAYLSSGLQRLANATNQDKRGRTLTQLCVVLSELSLQVQRSAKAGRIDAQGISHPSLELNALVGLQRQVLAALKPYTQGQEYGWLLDADHDDLQDGPIHVFEQMALLDIPGLVGPVTKYLFHRLEQRFDTDRPTIMPMDEAAITWGIPAYAEKGKEWMRRTRKFNVSMGFLTNSLEDVFNSPLGALLLQSCPTRYFLPDQSATDPQLADIYHKLGLTAEEVQSIATAHLYRDVYYSCKPLGRRMFHLPLSQLILDCTARNTTRDHHLIDAVLAKHGREGFAGAWLRQHGYEKEANDVEIRQGQPTAGVGALGTHALTGVSGK